MVNFTLCRFSGSQWGDFGATLCSVPVHTLACCSYDQQVAFYVNIKVLAASLEVLGTQISTLPGTHISTGDREGF